MAVVYSKVLLFDPPLIYTAPDICVFGAVSQILVSRGVRTSLEVFNKKMLAFSIKLYFIALSGLKIELPLYTRYQYKSFF